MLAANNFNNRRSEAAQSMYPVLAGPLGLAGHHARGLSPLGVAVVVAIGAAVWFLRLWLWPFGRCRWCRGSKTNPGSTKRRYGKCPRCKGSGQRVRFGARLVHRAMRREE